MFEHIPSPKTAFVSRRLWESLDATRRQGAPWERNARIGRETANGLVFVECSVVDDFPLFPIGQTVVTPGALDRLADSDLLPDVACAQLLERHCGGDWGTLPLEDHASNDQALRAGGRLFSAYNVYGSRFWVITEADRSATTILLPEEY
jgi:hypothetical protein